MNKLLIKDNKDSFFFKAIDEAYIYMPTIKNILFQNNIPKEFIYLAMVESHFSVLTHSNKEAVGIWQFTPETATDYNLKINRYIDERQDIVKSTQAAADFLNKLHIKFGKWYLAIIAYNCGAGRLSEAIYKAKSDKLAILLDENNSYIPKESKRYLRKIIAYTLLGNNELFLLNKEYDHFLNIVNTYSMSTVSLPAGESLQRVSQIINMPLDKLKSLNKHLKYGFTPPNLKRYNIYIPYAKLAEFKQKYFETLAHSSYKVHVVKKGDNLKMLSRKYNVSYISLVTFNKLVSPKLNLEQELLIPIK